MNELIEEMKAKVEARCGMTLTPDEVKQVFQALTARPEPKSAPEPEPSTEAEPETSVKPEAE